MSKLPVGKLSRACIGSCLCDVGQDCVGSSKDGITL